MTDDEKFEVEVTLAFDTEEEADVALAILNAADSVNMQVCLVGNGQTVCGKPVEWRAS